MPSSGTIAWKDLRLLLRDRVALFWVVGFPLVFALFFGSVMKAGVDSETIPMSVVLVDESTPAMIDPLAASLEHAGLRVSRQSLEQAESAVRRGEAAAFVRIPANGAIQLGIDPSRRTEAAMLQSLLRAAVAVPSDAADRPAVQTVSVARAHGGPRSGFEIVFPAMILWGLLGCAATFAISMVGERASGTLLRLRAAPITRASILGGKAAACVVACLLDAMLLSAIASLFLGVRIDDAGKYLAAVLATGLCFSGLTMALSVLGNSDQAVAGAGWATLILMAMLGGAMVPLSLMPEWMVTVSDLSPVKWGILSLEGATWRALQWAELLKPMALLVGIGALGFASGVAALVSWREV